MSFLTNSAVSAKFLFSLCKVRTGTSENRNTCNRNRSACMHYHSRHTTAAQTVTSKHIVLAHTFRVEGLASMAMISPLKLMTCAYNMLARPMFAPASTTVIGLSVGMYGARSLVYKKWG
jgi:hypothetical protein